MPELPEVERAARLLKQFALGREIQKVETNEDSIVFSGTSHNEFAGEITGRRVTDVGRYGKVFYVELDGEGRAPVLHFGMTGNLLVKGQVPIYYKEGPRKGAGEWPPRFTKFILHLSPDEDGDAPVEIAFVDARRLARIRLCANPLKEPPIVALGFDPILSMPSLGDFSVMVSKRSCPIKALLLDQSFSAGIGNWVADEVLYHARVHPEQRCNTLAKEQLALLHEKIIYVCRSAIDVNADASQFPTNWLFWHRWGKGKKKEGTSALQLPAGGPATLKWITVGGRTSAYVVELQLHSAESMAKANGKTTVAENKASESELTALCEDANAEEVAESIMRKRARRNTPKESTSSSVPIRASKRRKASTKA